MRVHTATTPLPARIALGRNLTPSTSTTTLCPKKNMWTKMREMVDRLVPFQNIGKAGFSPLGATNRDGNVTNREHHGQLSLNLPIQTQKSRPFHQIVQRTCRRSGVVIPPSSPFNTQSVRVPTTPAHIFFLRKKIPASHRARVGTSTVSLELGANRDGKERVKGKASRVQSTRIVYALVCVRWNVQHRELKLSKPTRFALVTVVMVAVPTGCVVSPPPLFSQNIQSHEKSPTSHRAQGVPPTVSLALGANREGKGRVKGKASRIQSSRIGSVCMYVYLLNCT